MSTFYSAFEAAHRGPRELIKERLRVYSPFYLPLRQLAAGGAALDLGCGRGEWLELLQQEGFAAHGVDLDEGMLAACHEQGLSVTCEDALAALEKLPDASQVLVSAFHLVEHLPFDAVRQLISQALRVLQPGGLLILETPNPENIVVGTNNFYLDPTHLRPLPAQLLEFAAQHQGFERTKVLRLQESPALAAETHTRLWDVFAGASPDYAVVAQKAADGERMELFDAAFERWFGLTVETLSERYEQRVNARFDAVSARAEEIGHHLSYRLDDVGHEQRGLRAELDRLTRQLDDLAVRAGAAEHRAAQWAEELIAIRSSTSWRITAPLRTVAEALKQARHKPIRPLNRLVGATIAQVSARPWLRQFVDRQLTRVPTLRTWVIARAAQARAVEFAAGASHDPAAQWRRMGPRARRRYGELDAAINGERTP